MNLKPSEEAQLAKLLAKIKSSAKPTSTRRQTREIKYLTEFQVQALFDAIDNARDRAILRITYHRGLRASEIGDLQLSDYLERDDRLIVRRLKGSAGGEYHLCSHEVRALKGWIRERGTAPGPLFPSRLGRPISRKTLHYTIRKYGVKAGLPPDLCHMHVLKHSCGTHLMNRGESIEDIQDHLGHRQVSNTLLYAKYTNKRRQERDRRLRDW